MTPQGTIEFALVQPLPHLGPQLVEVMYSSCGGGRDRQRQG